MTQEIYARLLEMSGKLINKITTPIGGKMFELLEIDITYVELLFGTALITIIGHLVVRFAIALINVLDQ